MKLFSFFLPFVEAANQKQTDPSAADDEDTSSLADLVRALQRADQDIVVAEKEVRKS